MLHNLQSFYQVISANAQRYPHKTILSDGDTKISNLELLAYADSVADYLHQVGIKRGDKVAILMTNSWQYIVNLFAISKLGAVIIPINSFLKADEIAYVLNDGQVKLLFASAKFAAEAKDLMFKTSIGHIVWVDGIPLENDKNVDFAKIVAQPTNQTPAVETSAEELAVIVYTSGTTGKPKGAMLAFRNINSNVQACMQQLRVKAGKIRMICYLPMFHAFTLTVTVMLPIFSNSGVIIIRSIATKKDFANLLKQVLLQRVPFFAGVPDVYSALAKANLPWYFHWFHAVKGFISGAAPLSDETLRRFSAAFKRGTLLQGYGISECSPVVSVNTPWENRPGSVGKALPSYQVACFNEDMQRVPDGEIGEICVKGDCVMLGYFNRPQETHESIIEGWFRTGDVGRVDSDGYIFIVDRLKDLIISKGMNIYPREIEEIIYTHEKVNACAVVGLKDSSANETPIAYVELKEGVTASEAELKDYLKPNLAVFKQPRKIIFLDKLPRNATGKILKRELRSLANTSEG